MTCSRVKLTFTFTYTKICRQTSWYVKTRQQQQQQQKAGREVLLSFVTDANLVVVL
jgi:hypothetical protein